MHEWCPFGWCLAVPCVTIPGTGSRSASLGCTESAVIPVSRQDESGALSPRLWLMQTCASSIEPTSTIVSRGKTALLGNAGRHGCMSVFQLRVTLDEEG